MASAVLATSSLGLHVPRTSQLRPRSLSGQMRGPLRRSHLRSDRAPLRTNAGPGLERSPQSQPPITVTSPPKPLVSTRWLCFMMPAVEHLTPDRSLAE